MTDQLELPVCHVCERQATWVHHDTWDTEDWTNYYCAVHRCDKGCVEIEP